MHKFNVTPSGQVDAIGATFEVTLHEYEFTNDRYGTEYVTSGQFDLDRNGAQWDRDL